MTDAERDVVAALAAALRETIDYLPIRRGALSERDRAHAALARAEALLAHGCTRIGGCLLKLGHDRCGCVSGGTDVDRLAEAASETVGADVRASRALWDRLAAAEAARDAAQAALAQAVAHCKFVWSMSHNATTALRWAAGIADATADEYDADSEADDEFAGVACRASRDGAREVAVRIRRGPAPEETK